MHSWAQMGRPGAYFDSSAVNQILAIQVGERNANITNFWNFERMQTGYGRSMKPYAYPNHLSFAAIQK